MKKITLKIVISLIIALTSNAVYGLQRTRISRALRPVSYTRRIPSSTIARQSFQCPQRSQRYTALPMPITYDWRNYLPWFYKKPAITQERQHETILNALQEKVLGKQSTDFTEASLDDLLQMLAKEDLINDKNKDGKTALILILEASDAMNKLLQISLIEKLQRYGADFGPEALKIAVDRADSDIVALLQPEYSLKDLYPEFLKTMNRIKEVVETMQTIKHLPAIYSIYASYLIDLKKIARILNTLANPTIVALPVFKDGKEQEEFFTIHSVSQLYDIMSTYDSSFVRYL